MGTVPVPCRHRRGTAQSVCECGEVGSARVATTHLAVLAGGVHDVCVAAVMLL